MPRKSFTLDSGETVIIYKRRGNRHLRLSITAAGQVRVSIPLWAPYRTGLEFAKSRQGWIAAQVKAPAVLKQGQAIGKGHHLNFVAKTSADKTSARVRGTSVTVTYPAELAIAAPAVQAVAHQAAIRSLRRQAQHLLPQRLASLAEKNGFEYSSVRIKQMTGRWGSCDQHGRIVLNLYLMQLPWDLIDYVLLHELTHTRVLKHGPDFWRAMEDALPQAKEYKRQLQAYRPMITVG